MSLEWGVDQAIDIDNNGLTQNTRMKRVGPGVSLPVALGATNQLHGIPGNPKIIRMWAMGDTSGFMVQYPNADLSLSLVGTFVSLISKGPDLSAGTATIYIEYIPG